MARSSPDENLLPLHFLWGQLSITCCNANEVAQRATPTQLKFKACLMSIISELFYPHWCMRGICYHEFSMDNLPTCHYRIIVRYVWWFVGTGGLQCFTNGT